LTTAQRQQVEGYLYAKWNIPVARHPYYRMQALPSTPQPNDVIIREGLDVWFDAKYEVSGTTIFAIAPTTNTTTLVGSATRVTTSVIYFNINGGYISTTYNPNLNNNTLYTFELWFWDNSAGGFFDSTALISNYGPSGTTPYVMLHIREPGTVLSSERNSSGTRFDSISTINVCNGQWHHIVKVATSTQQILYIDGVQNSSTSRPGGVITSGQNFVIGGNHFGRVQTCRIGLIRIYRGYALSANEVSLHYQHDKKRFET
jgi:hypothetical protein